MRVFISACGEGFGHSSRVIALGRELEKKGHGVVIACYGRALKRITAEGFRTIETRPEAKMVGSEGHFDILKSIVSSAGTPGDVAQAFFFEKNFIARGKFDAVVSDSRLSTTLAGYALGLPNFYLGNSTQFIPDEGTRHASSLREKLGDELSRHLLEQPLRLPMNFTDAILIPDFTPPNTVCAPILSKSPNLVKKTFIIGPLSTLCSESVKPVTWVSKKPRVLVAFGGQAFRQGEFSRVVRVLSKCRDFEFVVTSFFASKDEQFGSVRVRRFIPKLLPVMAAADYVVQPAGHSALMESVILQKPCVLIPDAGQPEQESNARQYQKLGLGLMLGVGELEKLPQKLRELHKNSGRFKKKLVLLSNEARNGQNGARNCVKLFEEYVSRVERISSL